MRRFAKAAAALLLALLVAGSAALPGMIPAVQAAGSLSVDVVSLEFVDTDIREILSLLAESMDKKILYLGKTYRVTVALNVVSPVNALEQVLETAGNLSYMMDGDIVIVGPKSKLKTTFLYSSLTREMKLNFLNYNSLLEVLETLQIPFDSLSPDESNPNAVTIQATPRNLAYLVEAISAVDRRECFTVNPENGNFELSGEYVRLEFARRSAVKGVLNNYQLDLRIVDNHDNEDGFYLFGEPEAVEDAKKLIGPIDVIDNVARDTLDLAVGFQAFSPGEIGAEAMAQILSESGLPLDAVVLSRNPSEVVVLANEAARAAAADIVKLCNTKEKTLTASVVRSGADQDALKTLAEQLTTGLGLESSCLAVSGNVASVGEEPLYALYAVGTAETVQKVRAAAS